MNKKLSEMSTCSLGGYLVFAFWLFLYQLEQVCKEILTYTGKIKATLEII